MEGYGQIFGGNLVRENCVGPIPGTANNDPLYLDDVPGYASVAPSITSSGCLSIYELSPTTDPQPIRAYLTGYADNAFTQELFDLSTGTPWDTLGWQFQRATGWWAYVASNSAGFAAFSVAGSQSADLRGTLWIPNGSYRGAALPWCDFPDPDAAAGGIRNNLRQRGDVVWRTRTAAGGDRIADVVLGDGYEAPEWTPNNTPYQPEVLPPSLFAAVASFVKPTDPTSTKRFKCIVGGEGGALAGDEPDWALAVNVGDPVGDNQVTWERVLDAPPYARFGKIYLPGTLTVDVTAANPTVLDESMAAYETLKLTGVLAAGVTVTIPSQDGWAGRVLDLTTHGAFSVTISAATSPGTTLTTTQDTTQRLYLEHDGASYNVRAEAPPA